MKSRDAKKIAALIKNHRSEFITRYRVRQTAVGYKIKNGKITDNVGIVVYVTKKQSESKLRSLQVEPIPKQIEGIITDVQPVRFFPRRADDTRYRPIEGGIAAIRHPSNYVGTLGLIIKKGNDLYGITNNHVGANEDVAGIKPSAKKGDPWIQPSSGRPKKDIIARLYRWNRLKPHSPGNTNYYDFAMGKIIGPVLNGAKDHIIRDVGMVNEIQSIKLGDKVVKRGRTTRKTIGKVIAVHARIYVPYQGYNCDFSNQVTIVGYPNPRKPFSLSGDSGSCIVSLETYGTNKSHKAKALLFAGGENEETGFDETIASPMSKIARDFGFKI